MQRLCRKTRVLITLDEIQWMDEVSYRLLLKLLQSIGAARLQLICTYQDYEEARVVRQLERLVREDRVKFLSLKPFSRAESDRIVLRVFPELREQPERLAALYEMTEGNAFFLKEMIALIREKGFVLKKTPKIDRLIAARLSGLTAAEREVLSCMAISRRNQSGRARVSLTAHESSGTFGAPRESREQPIDSGNHGRLGGVL